MTNAVLMQFTPHMPSLWGLLIIAFIALLVFGKRLPEIGRSLGKGIVEFKKGLQGLSDDSEDAPKEKRETPALPRSTTSESASTERRTEKDKSEVHTDQ